MKILMLNYHNHNLGSIVAIGTIRNEFFLSSVSKFLHMCYTRIIFTLHLYETYICNPETTSLKK